MQLSEAEERKKNQNPVLESKLRPPRLRKVLDRPRLLLQPESSTPRLINICAGPGFGKTTLMAQIAREFSGNSIWYQVDALDRDPAVFLRHMISGFSHACNFEGTRARSRLADVTDFVTESESVLAVLLDELGEHSRVPLIICFDDFQLFDDNADASRLIEYLIQNLPEQSCIAITTRRYPELSLARLRSNGALLELKDEDLQFSLDELSSLADTWEIDVSAAVLERVYRSTEGWPAGLVLSESFLRSGNDMPDLFSHRRIKQNVYEYLAEEVLNSQSAGMQQLLISAALIDPIDPAICEKALDIPRISEMLAEAEQQNLFTNRLDDAELYRYHPLFRDFLQSRLQTQAGMDGMNDIRARFAEAFISAGHERKAVEQYLAGGQHAKAITLIEKIGDEILNAAEYGTLQQWLNALKEDDLTPTLQIQQAKILMSAGKFRKAMRIFAATKPLLDPNEIELLLNFSFAYADCFNELGRCHEAIDTLKELLQVPLTDEMHKDILFHLAASYFIGFDEEGLKRCIDKNNELGGENEMPMTLGCEYVLMMQNLRHGNFSEALRMQEKYRDYEKLSESKRNLYTNNMASCLMMLGRYGEARSYAEMCLENVKKQQEIKALPVILDTYGCLLFAEGEHDRGKELLVQAAQICSKLEQKRGDTLAAIKCHLGTWARRSGNPDRALILHRESLEKAIETNEIFEIAASKMNIVADLIHITDLEKAEQMSIDAKHLSKKYNLRYVQTALDFSLAWKAYIEKDGAMARSLLASALSRSNKFQHNHWIIHEGKCVVPLFTVALESDIEVDYVCWVLERMGEKSLSAVEPLLKHENPLLRVKIAVLLGKIGSAGALTLLRRMRYDDNEFVQTSVQASLKKHRKRIKNSSDVLTNRELEVFSCLSQGLSNGQIAQSLYISECTVKTHVASIFRKMGFKSRLDAVIQAHQGNKE
ncbi:MAG: HEAT repeat domain-containing protein [Actinobacteria bacterium]|nr:HEAT repeat domain-containing protein [Actinomycetota bacterium]